MKGFNKTPAPIWLCFKANTAGSTVQLAKSGTPTSVTLETSPNGKNWSSYTIGDTITLSNIGDKVYFRNTSETDTGFSVSYSDYYQFVMTGSISAGGDTTSLLNKNGTTTVSEGCLQRLFNNCSSLTVAPELPATTLAKNCYEYMFYHCTSLTTAPTKLPATTLANWCYGEMFTGCTSLTTPPVLLATTLAEYCCYIMFEGCTALETVPSLPATTLAGYCYFSMFQGCTALTTLPKLPATTLAKYCYDVMFKGCTSIKLSTTQTGTYQTAYRIPTTGTGSAGTDSLKNMFTNTGGTFTGTPSINTTYYTSNTLV